jgi:hypothetical protein
MRARNAAAKVQAATTGSGPQRVLKGSTGSVRKAVRPVPEAATQVAGPNSKAVQAPAQRRYLVVEHLGDLKRIGRVIGEYSTLVLAQALLRAELEYGNSHVAILDRALGDAILDSTSCPVRVSLRAPRAGRS